MSQSDIEKASLSDDGRSSVERKLQLDHHGLPLVPQPSADPNDPLNWSRQKKTAIVVMMSCVAFFATFSMSVVNPAYVNVAKALHISARQASDLGSLAIAGAGVGCFIWSPLANVYGRRPVLVVAQLMSVAAGFGSAFSSTYRGILAGRFFLGLGNGAANVLTAVIMGDVFCLHERGKYIGIVTVALTNGPHVASLPGGYIAAHTTWRWTLILPSITSAICFFMILVGFPETLYLRGPGRTPPTGRDTFLGERKLWGFKSQERNFRAINIIRPLYLLKYPPIVLVSLFTGVAFTLGTIMPVQISAALFHTYYGWDSAHTGVALSVSSTVGGVLGEVIAGPVTDRLMRIARKGADGKVKPESRLHAMWPGVVLLPAGLLIFGFMIRFHKMHNSWVGACIAIGLTSFAMQVILTPGIAYVVDCYKGQAAQAVQILNFVRMMMAVSVGFWAIPFGDKVGYQFSGLALALVTLAFYVPILWLMRYGESIRARLGEPTFDVE